MYLHGAFTAIKNPLSCCIQLSKNIKIILHIVIPYVSQYLSTKKISDVKIIFGLISENKLDLSCMISH